MSSFLGIDLGTSSAKAVLIGEDGEPAGYAAANYGFARGGISGEIDPDSWLGAVARAVNESVDGHTDVAAIGLTGQMHGVVLCDAAGQATRPALTWVDTRANVE